MGYYVNPVEGTKEDWLTEHGEVITAGQAEMEDDFVPVVLVDNGLFTAAAIAYNRAELDAFLEVSDSRPKTWYRVPREKLVQFCIELASM